MQPAADPKPQEPPATQPEPIVHSQQVVVKEVQQADKVGFNSQ